MKTHSNRLYLLLLLLFGLAFPETRAQELNITGDTIFVNAEAEVMVRFPSLPSFYNTVPSNAPYNIKTAGTGFTIIARSEKATPAPLFVIEGGRNHKFLIVFKKKIDYNNEAEMDYDFSSTNKIEQHIKFLASAAVNDRKNPEAVNTDTQKDKSSKKEKQPENTAVNYYALLEAGDDHLKKKDFVAAKQSFEKALYLRPNDQIPKQRLDEVKLKIAQQQRNAEEEKNRQYIDVTNTARSFLQAKKYTQAQESFKKALDIRPGDIYATHQIELIQEIIKTENNRKDKLKLDELYKNYMAAGEKAVKKNDLPEARIAYEQALVIKPNDLPATDKLKIIEEQEKKQLEAEKAEANYSSTIVYADKFFKTGDYDEAKEAYTRALGFSKKTWPQEQIKKINKLQAAQQAKDKLTEQKRSTQPGSKQKESIVSDYNSAIHEADRYFAAKDFTKAANAYNRALSIENKPWPKDQLKLIKKLVTQESTEKQKTAPQPETAKQEKERKKKTEKEKQALEKEYKKVIREADDLFKKKDYLSARSAYYKAIALSIEKWPQDQVVRINSIIEEQVARENAEKAKQVEDAAIHARYTALMDKANAAFDKGHYSTARKTYLEAGKLKPAEKLPNEKIVLVQTTLDQIAFAEKARKDSIAAAVALQRKYKLVLSKAKSYYLKDDLTNASLAYMEASTLKPRENEPRVQLKAIQVKMYEMAKANAINTKYEQKIAVADSLLILKSYQSALGYYQDALKLKPGEYYSQKQINYVHAEIKNEQKHKEDIAKLEAYRKEEEQEKQCRDAFNRGKQAIANEKYDVAKMAYAEILKLRPENEYAQHMLDVCNYQIAKAKRTDVKRLNTKRPENAEIKENDQVKKDKKNDDRKLMDPDKLPYSEAQLRKKYPGIDFSILPPEQYYNVGDVKSFENSTLLTDIINEKPRLSISTSDNKVSLTCQGISFEDRHVYIKFRVENNSKSDFLTGAMILTWTKKSGNRIKLYPFYLYPAVLPIITPGKEAIIIYVCKSYYISDQESLQFELTDRLNKIKLAMSIPGKMYNEEESR